MRRAPASSAPIPDPQLGLHVVSQKICCPSAQRGAEERAGGSLPFWSPLPAKDAWNPGCAPPRRPARTPLQTPLLTRRDTPSTLDPGMMRKVSGSEIPAVVCCRRLHQGSPAPRGALSPTGSIFNPLTVGGARPPALGPRASRLAHSPVPARGFASRTPIGCDESDFKIASGRDWPSARRISGSEGFPKEFYKRLLPIHN